MSYRGYDDVFEEFRRVMREMDRMMGGMGGEMRRRAPQFTEARYREPLVDLNDTGETIVVTAELPGTSKDKIEVGIVDEVLEIKTSQKDQGASEGGGYSRQGRRASNFFARVPLPTRIDPAGVKATFNNGVLEVTMPKLERVQRHNVAIE